MPWYVWCDANHLRGEDVRVAESVSVTESEAEAEADPETVREADHLWKEYLKNQSSQPHDCGILRNLLMQPQDCGILRGLLRQTQDPSLEMDHLFEDLMKHALQVKKAHEKQKQLETAHQEQERQQERQQQPQLTAAEQQHQQQHQQQYQLTAAEQQYQQQREQERQLEAQQLKEANEALNQLEISYKVLPCTDKLFEEVKLSSVRILRKYSLALQVKLKPRVLQFWFDSKKLLKAPAQQKLEPVLKEARKGVDFFVRHYNIMSQHSTKTIEELNTGMQRNLDTLFQKYPPNVAQILRDENKRYWKVVQRK